MEIFELIGASTTWRRLQAATSRGLTGFVGRQTEVDALERVLAPAGGGHGQVVALVGEPGVGKSRLVYEFVHSYRTRDWLLLESVRTLVETGILAGQSGGYRLAKPLASIRVPATVQAVLTARIDRLLSEEKRLLQTAAVIGTEVPFPLLQAVAKLPEEALRRGLAHLQAAELLYETSLFPELAYTFKHALTHEVAYGSLLQERRRGLHALIVEALETLYPDRLAEQVERLAHHAFRGEMWDKALTYFREAGVKAGTCFACPEAVACFEQALEALTHLPESRHTLEQGIDRQVVLRTALLPLGEFRRIHDLLRDAATLAEALHDQRRLGLISDRLCLASWQMGDYGAALQFGQRALAISKASGDVNPAIDDECRFSTHLHRTG